ncbi:MAG TPA: hypothetical protein VIM81_18490 [Gammaproteobacteria bacterium]
MFLSTRTLTLATALLVPLSLLRAETAADPSGHWEGAIHAPSGDVPVEVDLRLDDGDTLAGTFTSPAERIKGFPLWSATVEGMSVSLELKFDDSGVRTFAGNLSADGASMSGDLLVNVYAVPFNLARTGEAKIEAPPRSPAIDEAWTGEWSASLDVGGKPLPLELTLSNHADGTAMGSWASGGGTAVPISIAHQDRSLTLTSTVTPAAYAGTVNADGTEISGIFTAGPLEQTLTFTRAAGR